MFNILKFPLIILSIVIFLIIHQCSLISDSIVMDDDTKRKKITFNRELLSKDEGDITKNNPYKDTEDAAQEIEGPSMLHTIYNSMIKISKSSEHPDIFKPSVVAGIASRESGFVGNTWIFDFKLPSGSNSKKLLSWGYNDAFKQYDDTGSISISITGAVGIMQVQPSSYLMNEYVTVHPSNSAGARNARARWGYNGYDGFKFDEVTNWEAWVSSASEMDFSGDNKGDLFNPLDAIGYSRVRFDQQYNSFLSKYNLVSDQYKEDILSQGFFQMYVGVPSFYSGNVEENSNPLIALFRKAAEEYHNKGPRYLAFKQSMENGNPSNRRAEAIEAVWGLYQDNGWTVNGSLSSNRSSASKNGVTVSNTQSGSVNDQALYAISCYWSGFVTMENIERVLKETPN